jgi:hypothetical protein
MNYKEEVVAGEITKWRRMSHGVLTNGEIPKIELHDEDRTVLPDGTSISQYVGALTYAMTDPTVEIPLIDPETFEPTEQTMTAGQIWLALASVYLWLARQRDGAA